MSAIIARAVRVHNLKGIDVRIPYGKLVVVTGVSGSGKSSLAFDTLYAEGQRRYVESLSSYVRQFLQRMERPELDSITGLLPAIAIESKNVITHARSTVGTQTELADYLRLLFARVGETFCSGCNELVEEQPASTVAARLLSSSSGATARIFFNVRFGSAKASDREDFTAELLRQGFVNVMVPGAGSRRMVDLREGLPADLMRHASLRVFVDEVQIDSSHAARLAESLETAYRFGKGFLEVEVSARGEHSERLLFFSQAFHCARCDRSYPKPTPQLFSFNSPLGACPTCQGFGRVISIDPNLVVPDPNKSLAEGAIAPWTRPSAKWEAAQLARFCKRKKIPWRTPWRELSEKHRNLIFEGERGYFGVNEFFAYLEKKIYRMHVRVFLSRYRNYAPCPACKTTRLKPEALGVRVCGKTIADLAAMPLADLLAFFHSLTFRAELQEKIQPVLDQILSRLSFLVEIGVGYLTLSRPSRTLSGGESQRINLATSLGSALVDTLYVLDEPSVGLHERDNQLLIGILRKLRELGNTVVVVEHDKTMIRSADEIIDLGPEAGSRGGEVVYQGSLAGLLASERSITAKYLRGELQLAASLGDARGTRRDAIRIEGARQHNLKAIDIEIPLHCFCVVSGVSGSGKSSLLEDVLYGNFLRARGRPVQEPGAVARIRGLEKIDDMLVVDRSPIGRTPRSNPLTYMKAFDVVRKVFARTHEARLAGLKPGDFSFNATGGRCETCKGEGKIKVEMHFLADLYITCEDCRGTRYQDRVLAVHHKGLNVDGVFKLTVDEALAFFKGEEGITRRLKILSRVGLGYLALGQAATTLSQGESQRLKLSLELLERPGSHILYLFDEPTTGLHDHDIRALLDSFRELLRAGHSVVVIEHNLDVIRCADWVIDLGPEGGEAGGQVVAAGTPREVAGIETSHTGRFLRQLLEERGGQVRVSA